MLDTHAVARSLTDAQFTEAQADAITTAVRLWPRNMATMSTTDRFEAGRVGCPGNRACPGLPGRAVNARTCTGRHPLPRVHPPRTARPGSQRPHGPTVAILSGV